LAGFEDLNVTDFGRGLLTPQMVCAVVAMTAFWMTIVQPDSILPGEEETGPPGSKNFRIHSADIIKQAETMAPSRLLEAGKPDLAIEEAHRLAEAKPHDVVANLAAGNVLCTVGDKDEGFLLLKRSVALAPRSRYVRMNLAEKLASAKRYDEAIAQYNLILQGYGHWSKPHLALANIYIAQERYADAASELQAALDSEPNNGEVRKLRGVCLARSGKIKRGLDEYVMGDAIQQNFAGLPADLKQLVTNWGSLERADFELGRELELNGDNPTLKLRRARIMMYTGRVSEAKPLLMEARKKGSTDAELHMSLAIVLQKLGDSNLAQAEFMQALSLQKKKEQEQPD